MKIYNYIYSHIMPPVFILQESLYKHARWLPILGDTVEIKYRAANGLNLQLGDKVMVYCIGTGFELSPIMKKIGKTGFVVGVDISEGMLKKAQEKIDKNKWKNVQLVCADVTKHNPTRETGYEFDAALCNFGPPTEDVIYKMISAVKSGGRIAISGPQPLKGIRKIFYPITFVPEMLFGLTWKHLQKYKSYRKLFEKELSDTNFDEKTFAKYFIAMSGTKKS